MPSIPSIGMLCSIISITCPLITTFIANCYIKPARLYVLGNHKVKSRKGTTQGDPKTPLIHFLSKFIFINEQRSKEVAFVDDVC